MYEIELYVVQILLDEAMYASSGCNVCDSVTPGSHKHDCVGVAATVLLKKLKNAIAAREHDAVEIARVLRRVLQDGMRYLGKCKYCKRIDGHADDCAVKLALCALDKVIACIDFKEQS